MTSRPAEETTSRPAEETTSRPAAETTGVSGPSRWSIWHNGWLTAVAGPSPRAVVDTELGLPVPHTGGAGWDRH
jgi:hypothetical protein